MRVMSVILPRRFLGFLVPLAFLAVAVWFFAAHQMPSVYATPTQIASTSARPLAGGALFYLGGVVVYGTREDTGTGEMRFVVTDYNNDIPVVLRAIPPRQFAEGRMVMMRGAMTADNIFVADRITATTIDMFVPPRRDPFTPHARAPRDESLSPVTP